MLMDHIINEYIAWSTIHNPNMSKTIKTKRTVRRRNNPIPSRKAIKYIQNDVNDDDDDDNNTDDDAHQPMQSKRSRTTQLCKLDGDLFDDIPNSVRIKAAERAQALQLKYSELEQKNPALYNAYKIEDPTSMINLACVNVINYKNFKLLEWSEAVLLQMLDLSKPLDFANNSWVYFESIARINAWQRGSTLPLWRNHRIGVTIDMFIRRNHEIKTSRKLIEHDHMFREVPDINFDAISMYRLSSDQIANPIVDSPLMRCQVLTRL